MGEILFPGGNATPPTYHNVVSVVQHLASRSFLPQDHLSRCSESRRNQLPSAMAALSGQPHKQGHSPLKSFSNHNYRYLMLFASES